MAEKTTTPTTPKVIRTGTYEGMFLFGAAAAQDLNGAQNTVRGFIEKHGGQILVLKRWDERKLAYEVTKQKRGVYIIAYFTAPTTAIAPIEREVRLSEEVLRLLVTDADHLTQPRWRPSSPSRSSARSRRRGSAAAGSAGTGAATAGIAATGAGSRWGPGRRPWGDRAATAARGPRREEQPAAAAGGDAGAAKTKRDFGAAICDGSGPIC
jgi:small subunit ribosomal protein S6